MKLMNNNYLSEVLEISLPAAGEMTAYTLMSIFDTMMIGNYGGNIALNAVGICNEITSTLINIFIAFGITISISSLVARSIGARDDFAADEYGTLGLVVGILLAGIFTAFVFYKSGEILRVAGARDLVLIKSTVYMRSYSAAMFLIMVINLINGILRGYGNTFTPFFAAVIITLIKLLLDMCLIFGKITPRLGIEGAALASVISQFVGFLYLAFFMHTHSKVKINLKYILRPKLESCRELIGLAIPSTLQEAAYSISRLIGTFIVMYAGTSAFAANQIANTVETISIMPAVGFGAAATTFVGIKFGERNLKKARQYAYSCTFWAVFISLLFALVFLFLPKLLIGTFIGENEGETLRLGALCLAVGAFEQPTIAVDFVMSGALKGAGDTRRPLYISLFTSWAIRLPLMFFFIYILKKSVVWVWWITVLQWGTDAILTWYAFKKLFYR